MSDNEYEINDEEIDFLCEAVKKVEIEEVTTIVKKTKKIPPKKEVKEKKGKNEKDMKDEAWRHIFDELSYNGESDLEISATEIKKIGKKASENIKSQFEPRLLSYQDSIESRPNVFKEKDLYIIAIKNGVYMILKENIYYTLSYETENPIIYINKNKKSRTLKVGNSESSLLDNLYYSGVFEREELLNEKILYGPLLNGRHYTKTFDVGIGSKTYKIQSVQYETDACYESENKIVFIECKNKKPNSFNIRQLYYSFRTLYDEVNDPLCEFLCLFIGYDKGIIYIWKFTFDNPKVMTSIKCHSLNRYSFVKE